ncbi:MAG: cyanophycinase [Opitutales bacterium]|nr:cyanophycinase [Opitutales bacterium]MDG2168106.1 cyanophycinase [Opitutales bacterium]
MKQLLFSQILLILCLLVNIGLAQERSGKTKVGPENGTLLIVGGGAGKEMYERFIELAGGNDAPLVYISTASPSMTAEQREERGDRLRALGATNVTVMHTLDRSVANSEAFVAPLKEAKGVWFGGGRQWNLVDAYAGTKVEALLWEVLEREGVIAGSSAGATIQGSYLARGDTRNNQIMVGDHEVGFGYLRNVAIDQHHLARNRHFDMFTILKVYPDLLGVGIDENTAMLVQGDQFEVVGESYVTIYDGSFWSKEGTEGKEVPDPSTSFYFLSPGDRYDMAKRQVITTRR